MSGKFCCKQFSSSTTKSFFGQTFYFSLKITLKRRQIPQHIDSRPAAIKVTQLVLCCSLSMQMQKRFGASCPSRPCLFAWNGVDKAALWPSAVGCGSHRAAAWAAALLFAVRLRPDLGADRELPSCFRFVPPGLPLCGSSSDTAQLRIWNILVSASERSSTKDPFNNFEKCAPCLTYFRSTQD